MKTNKPFKIISDVDASNFPVLADFVGKRILATEYYKALDGKDFDIINEEAEATREEGDTTVEEATKVEAPKKAKATKAK